jgi:WD40 repeat protein
MLKKIIIFSLTALLIGVAVNCTKRTVLQGTKGTGSQHVNLPAVAPPEVDEVFVQVGHSGMVESVAFSPDGKTALLASMDKTVKWWDLSTGRVIKTLKGHSSWVNSVAFSPDGKTALSGSGDKTVKWWDLSTGRVIKTLEGHSSDVKSVAFSPDGKTALSGSGDNRMGFALGDNNTVKWWDLSTGRVIKTLEGPSSPVYSVAFSPDGKTALSGSGNTVKWWDLSTGRVIKTLKGHSSSVKSVAFSPDGKTALSSSFSGISILSSGKMLYYKEKTVKWWDLSTGRVINTLKGHSRTVKSVAFSPDGKTALSGSWDKTVKWWDLSTGRVINTLKGHSRTVKSVAFSPDGKTALSGSGDKTVKWWDLSTGRVINTLEGHSESVHSVAFSTDGKTALSGSGDKTVKWWDLSTGRVINTLKGHSRTVKSVAFSPNGKTALSGSLDTTTRLWNLQTSEEIIQMVGFKDGEWVAIMPQGYYATSPKGEQYINVRVGNRVYGIDKYKTFYHHPDILKLALQLGDAQRAIALINKRRKWLRQRQK